MQTSSQLESWQKCPSGVGVVDMGRRYFFGVACFRNLHSATFARSSCSRGPDTPGSIDATLVSTAMFSPSTSNDFELCSQCFDRRNDVD